MIQTFSTGRALLDAHALLARAGLTLGMTYADFGAGTLGHFVFPASSMVGEKGEVFAVDILKSALSAIDSRSKMEAVNNIITIWGDMERKDGVNISSKAVDLVSLINVVTLAQKTPMVLEEIKRVLKHKGILLMMDWDPKSNIGPVSHGRISSDAAVALAQRSGFKLLEKFSAGPYHWGALFELM